MRPVTVLLAIACLASAPARAEVIEQSETSFVIHFESDVAATPTQVWNTLVAPQGWWSKDHTYSGDASNLFIDSQATGCFCEKIPAPEGQRMGSVEHARVIAVLPGRMLRMTGAIGPLQSEAVTATLTIALKSSGDSTHLSWNYVIGGAMRLKVADVAPQVDKVLGEQFAGLVAKAGAAALPAEEPTPRN